MVLTGLDAVLFVLNNSKQKQKKFLNFHQNSLENKIIFAKNGVAPSEPNVTLTFENDINRALLSWGSLLWTF